MAISKRSGPRGERARHPLLFVLGCVVPARAYTLPQRIRLRSGFPDDDLAIPLVMARELMNPLGISHRNNLVVAEDERTGRRVGWAQIRPLGYAGDGPSDAPPRFEDGDDPSNNPFSRIDVQKQRSIEEDVDEIIWEEYEDEDTEFPNGFASLPWTKEYRAASQAAEERLRRRERLLKLDLGNRPKIWELSSVYVAPGWRNQGIGSSLVDQVLNRHATTKERGKDIYALTLAKTVPWYERFGFAEEEEGLVPSAMVTEKNVGRMITNMIGEDLVCIRATLPS